MKKALVITPTTGASELLDAIESVKNQTYEHVEHLIVIDGKEFSDRTKKLVNKNTLICELPYNTGGGGWYGHRVMAAFSHLVPHDYILFLDQDNWYQPNHIEKLIYTIEKFNFDWAFSLRNIFSVNKEFICQDNCESLGRFSAWVDDKVHLVDSSSYCFTNAFIRKYGYIWDHGWGADRRFYTIITEVLKHTNFGCSNNYTLCYRLGGNEGSVNAEFFIEGNEKIKLKYGEFFPWNRTI